MTEALESQMEDISIPRGWPLGERVALKKVGAEARKVVYTDLDGTVLHPLSYSYAPALEGVRRLQEKKIPIIFCSAKTLAEQEALRKELGIRDPFIVENGGAIYIPKDYFRFPFSYDKVVGEYLVIELGASYTEIKQRLKIVAEIGNCKFTSFGDMGVEEVARLTGLNLQETQRAKERQYSETIIMTGSRGDTEITLDAIRKEGLRIVFGGRFFEVSLGSDKGKAVKILNELFKLNFGNITTFGVGDSENDTPMLESVDCPLLVQNGKGHWGKVKVKGLIKVKGIGPTGFSQAVREFIPGHGKTSLLES